MNLALSLSKHVQRASFLKDIQLISCAWFSEMNSAPSRAKASCFSICLHAKDKRLGKLYVTALKQHLPSR